MERNLSRYSTDVCTRRTTTASVVFLAVIAAVVSSGHMHELALQHGEMPPNATLIPLSVDGMVVASSMSVLIASRTGIGLPWLPWTLPILGSLASLAANVAVAEPTAVGRVIAAGPRSPSSAPITCFRGSYGCVCWIRRRRFGCGCRVGACGDRACLGGSWRRRFAGVWSSQALAGGGMAVGRYVPGGER